MGQVKEESRMGPDSELENLHFSFGCVTAEKLVNTLSLNFLRCKMRIAQCTHGVYMTLMYKCLVTYKE